MSNVVEIAIKGIDMATQVFEQVGSAAEKSMEQAQNSVQEVDSAITNVSDLDVDTSETEKALDEAESSIQEVDDSIENVSDLEVDTSNTEQALINAEESVQSVDDSIQNVSDLEVNTDSTEQALQSTAESIREVDESIESIPDVDISTEEALRQIESVGIEIEGLDEAIQHVSELDVETGQSSSAIESVVDSVNDLDEAVQNVDDLDIDTGNSVAAIDDVTSSINDVSEAIEDAEETGMTFGESMSDMLSKLQDNWMGITEVAGTVGERLEGFASSQGKVNAAFERTAVMTGMTADELRDLATELMDTTTSASQQAEAFEMLVQRGIDTKEQFREIIPHISNLGTATGQDLQPTLESVERILAPLGQGVENVGENIDQLGRIMLQTDIPLSSLERNLNRIPDELQALDWGLDEVAAGLEVFRDKGYRGREAVREFRRAVEASEGDLNAFLEIVGLTNAEWEKYQQVVEPAVGFTEEIAGVNEKNMTVMEKLNENLQNLLVKYGGLAQAAGLLGSILMGLGPTLNAFTEAKKLATMAAKGFNLTLSANPIGIVITVIGALIAILWTLFGDWEAVSEFLSSSWEWIKNVAEEVFGAIGEAISSAWEWISEVTSEIWNGIKEFFTEYWDLLLAAIFGPVGLLVRTIIQNWDEIKETTAVIWEAIKEFFVTIFEAVSEVFNTFTETVAEIWNTVWETAKEVVETIWNGILEFFTWIWEGIKNVFSTTIETIQNAIQTAWDWITNITNSVWNGISGFFTNIWNTISNVFTTSVDRAKNIITNAWDSVKNVTENVFGRIRDFFSNIWDRITSGVEKMKERFIGAWNGITDGVKSAVNVLIGLINSAIGGIEGMVNAVARAVNSLPSFEIPDWVPIVGGGTFGLPNIPTISLPRIPALAKGGIVTKETIALIGEGRDHEAVIPLNNNVMAKLGAMIGDNIKGRGDSIDYRKLAEAIADALARILLPALNELSLADVRLIVQEMNVSNDYDIVEISRQLKRLIDKARRGKGEGW